MYVGISIVPHWTFPVTSRFSTCQCLNSSIYNLPIDSVVDFMFTLACKRVQTLFIITIRVSDSLNNR